MIFSLKGLYDQRQQTIFTIRVEISPAQTTDFLFSKQKKAQHDYQMDHHSDFSFLLEQQMVLQEQSLRMTLRCVGALNAAKGLSPLPAAVIEEKQSKGHVAPGKYPPLSLSLGLTSQSMRRSRNVEAMIHLISNKISSNKLCDLCCK